MSIKTVSIDELRRMTNSQGIVLQGCGGDLQEWVDGFNDLMTKENILLDGSKFENCVAFQNGDVTCILYPFEGAKVNLGKLSIWRIASHETFGGMWFDEFVSKNFGGFTDSAEEQRQKPDCPLIGQDGNIFNLMGIAARTLRQNGMADEAKEMQNRITGSAQSYSEALNIIGEYVNITSADDVDEDMDEGMGMRQ